MIATEVHAWIDLRAAPDLEGAVSAEVRSSTGRRLVGRVQSVGAERLQMPKSLWARADAPEWGYLIRVEVAAGELAPGEPVFVGLHPG